MEPLIEPSNFKGTLADASYDTTHKVSLIDNKKYTVYILDEMAKEIGQKFEMDTPSSFDSVYFDGNIIYFMEFKNRDYHNVNPKQKKEIRKKFYQSRELLLSIFFPTKTLEYISEHTIAYVIFKTMDGRHDSLDKIQDMFHKYSKSDKPPIKCGLDKFIGTFYKDVYTIGVEDFEKNHMPKIFKENTRVT